MQKRNKFRLFVLVYIILITSLHAKVIDKIQLDFDGESLPPSTIIPHSQLDTPSIGLALSGGGMRGVTQIGVLKVLEANNVPIDYIVGTSIGAAIGALYASGYSADDIYKLSQTIEWTSILRDEAERSSLFLGEKQKRNRSLFKFQMKNLMPVIPEALTPGQKLTETFADILFHAPIYANDFNNLKVPLKIIATDLLSGKKVILTSGDLSTCVRGSTSIPLLFKPVELDSFLLVDGGISQNIPVTETLQSNVDIVIAVDATSPLRTEKELGLPWEIADQVTTIMQQNSDNQQAQLADILISFEDFYSINTNFEALDSLYTIGLQRARKKLPEIQKLLQAKTDDSTCYSIDFILQSDDEIQFQFEKPGKIKKSQIISELRRIYSNGAYKNIYATINTVNSDTVLEIHAIHNPKLSNVRFSGNHSISNDSLQAAFLNILGNPIGEKASKEAILNLLGIYRKNGFSLAGIQHIEYDADTETAMFHINEGTIGKINYIGLQKTKRWVIKRESKIKAGQTFVYKDLRQTLNNIYATNLFSNINIEIQPDGDLYDINLYFFEKQSDIMRLGARYDQERFGKFFFEYADENIMGTGNDLAFHVLYGSRDLGYHIDYRVDQIWQSLMTAHLNLHYGKTHHYSYQDKERTGEYNRLASGLTVEVGRQLERFGTLIAEMKFENIDILGEKGSGYSYGSMQVNSLGIKSVIDTRDNAPFPKSGTHHIFQYAVTTGQIFNNWRSFFHVRNQLATFTTLAKKHTFSPKIIWGTSDTGTPYSEQFKLGGQNSFYGLREEQVSGIHMFQASMGYRYQLPKLLKMDSYIAARYDFGGAWKKLEDIGSESFLSGYGIALMMKTPFGPFQLDYGRTRSGFEQFYISAGYKF